MHNQYRSEWELKRVDFTKLVKNALVLMPGIFSRTCIFHNQIITPGWREWGGGGGGGQTDRKTDRHRQREKQTDRRKDTQRQT